MDERTIIYLDDAIDMAKRLLGDSEISRTIQTALRILPSAQPDLPIKKKCAFCSHCNNCDVNDDLSIQPCMDTISRQAAIDDFTKWKYQLADCFGEDYSGVSIVESAIKSLEGYPSAQPVIQCKDCKHQVKEWRDDKRLKDKGYWVYGCKVISDICGYWAWFGQDDEFCSEAERRTDGV